MIIQDLILEMIYDDIDQITRKVGNRLNAELKHSNKIEITDLIPEKYKLPEKRAFIKYIKKGPPQNYVESVGKNVIFTIKWPVDFEEQWTTNGKILPTLRTLKHELIHVLDYMQQKDEDIKDVYYNDNSIDYYMDDYEFNVMINSIKEYKRLHPRSWNKISSLDKIYHIIQTHGYGAINVDEQLKKSRKFKNRLLNTLKNADLIPPLMHI